MKKKSPTLGCVSPWSNHHNHHYHHGNHYPGGRAWIVCGLVTCLAVSLGACAQPGQTSAPLLSSPAPVSAVSTVSSPSPQLAVPADVPFPGVIELAVDATDTERRIVRVKQTMPVRPGRLTLLYPRWLPGTHGPSGNPISLAGLTIQTAGFSAQRLAWVRDPLDPQTFHIDIPQGVSLIVMDYQHLVSSDNNRDRVTVTPKMLNLQWNTLVLYPAGHHSDQIRYQAQMTVPPGWQAATGLRAAKKSGDTTTFETVSLTTLIDSPVFAGRNFKRVELAAVQAGQPAVALNIVADDEDELKADDKQIQAHKDLVTQADRLFGSRPYRQYDFLFAITEELGRIGLEHHESSENGVKSGYFKDWDKRVGSRELLPHEYVHSWNGKFRRPADLLTPNFNVPMQNSLLWVYEGQTQYWGRVLTSRSGLATAEQIQNNFALVAASYEGRPGRAWRNLQDTTNIGTMNSRGDEVWRDWQRTADYYDEATLIWLDADTLIREKTNGEKSLDDFARAFFGVTPQRAADGAVQPMPYRFEDVVAGLNAVLPYDWSRFLRQRLDTNTQAPLEGLTRSGWRLAFVDEQPAIQKSTDAANKGADFTYSVGLAIGEKGRVTNVRWEGPAFKAGLSPATSVIAVNNRDYKPELLSAAIKEAKDSSKPIELLTRQGDNYRTVKIDWRGGLRYPKLERIAEVPDRLTPILTAR